MENVALDEPAKENVKFAFFGSCTENPNFAHDTKWLKYEDKPDEGRCCSCTFAVESQVSTTGWSGIGLSPIEPRQTADAQLPLMLLSPWDVISGE